MRHRHDRDFDRDLLAERHAVRELPDGYQGVLLMHSRTGRPAAWTDPLHPDRAGANFVHPSGPSDLTELSEFEMSEVAGAAGTGLVGTLGCCWCVPWYSSWTVCGLLCHHAGCH